MLAVTLITLSVLGTSLVSPECPRKVLGSDRPALQKWMKKAFPSTKVSGLQCACYGLDESCPQRQWRFEPFTVEVEEARLRFRLQPMANFNVNGHPGLRMLPFADLAHAKRIARAVRETPAVAEAFQDVALECDAGQDAPGNAVYFACGPTASNAYGPSGSGPLGDVGYSVGFLILQDTPDVPRLNAWSFTADRVPESAPGWKAARETPVVKEMLKGNPRALVDFYRGATLMVTVRPEARAKTGVLVKFTTAREWYATEPGPVLSTHADLKARYAR